MKAIVYIEYGPPEVLKLKEVEKPVPQDDELLIKIHATTVTMGDCEIRSLKFSGWLKFVMRLGIGVKGPRKKHSILGQEFAGKIESVGSEVSLFKEGDSVFGTPGFRFGTYAEYICMPEDNILTIKPTNMTFEEAATIPLGGLEALHYLKKANIEKGQTILIRGASGTIGIVAIQLAKYYGAKVTGVGNPKSLEVMKSIGADKVIDYTTEDFTKTGETYDIMFDIIGNSKFLSFVDILNKDGIYLLANPKLSMINREKRLAKKAGIKYISGNRDSKKQIIEDLLFLKKLFKEGNIKSVIDKRYQLEQLPEAHKYVEIGEKVGNVVINMEESL